MSGCLSFGAGGFRGEEKGPRGRGEEKGPRGRGVGEGGRESFWVRGFRSYSLGFTASTVYLYRGLTLSVLSEIAKN